MAPTNSRIKIDIVEIRAQDVQPGDIVNRRGHQRDGWIEVTVVSAMQSGELLIADESERLSFTSAPLDLIWLQIARPLRGNSHFPIPD
jgi:hypothetical protein